MTVLSDSWLKARRAEIDRKDAAMPFRAANIRPRRAFTCYTHRRLPVNTYSN